MASALIHQIFYDDATFKALDPDFIPLDNSKDARPDWFEFLPILKFLESNELEPDSWYGFVSPRFREKTGCSAHSIKQILASAPSEVGAFLFSPYWLQLAFYRNVFEQGDSSHPGMTALAQQFFDRIGFKVDLADLVSHTGNAVFCNYFAAKPAFWREWLVLARPLFEIAESPTDPLGQALAARAPHGIAPGSYSMKVFIQERIATVVLARTRQPIASMDFTKLHIPTGPVVDVNPENVQKLRDCNLAKQAFIRTKDHVHLDRYYQLRAEVQSTLDDATDFREMQFFKAGATS